MTMTMSDHHPDASAPLDLTIRTRETTARSKAPNLIHWDNAAALNVGDRVTGASPQGRKDSEEPPAVPSCPKRNQVTDKRTLPIRKRPFPTDTTQQDQSRTVQEPQTKLLITHPSASPSPAEVPKCGAARNGLTPDASRLLPSPSPGGTHGASEAPTAQSPPCYKSFLPSPPYSSVLTPQMYPQNTERLMEEIAMATRQDEDGDTALHIAVVQENKRVVSWLIHVLRWAGHNLDVYNNLRQTPLHLAVITHQPGMVEAFLQGGADPGALDRNGQTALHLCCVYCDDTCLSIILYHLSCTLCCSPTCLNSANYEGLTPLHLAVQGGSKKLAKMLLDTGADINAVDIKSGRSPLVYAVENNCLNMIIFLIENGCNVNAQSYSGNTALHIACGRGEVEAVRILLKNGADSSLKNYHNDTAVMVAKNKEVSDVLRGKTRGHALKSQYSFNGVSSPNLSPLATPNRQCSASVSPPAVFTHSPHSLSGESRSANLSPTETQETKDLPIIQHPTADKHADYVSLHPFPFVSAQNYDRFPHVSTYYPSMMHSVLCTTNTQYILIPTRNVQPVSQRPPSRPPGASPRPSSHNSDQSEISSISVSSEGKGIS